MAYEFRVAVEDLRSAAQEDLGTIWTQLWTARVALDDPSFVGSDSGGDGADGAVAGSFGAVLQTLQDRQRQVYEAVAEIKSALLDIAEVYAIADGQNR